MAVPLVDPGPPLTRAQVERYARHLSLPEIGVTGQRRLLAARVLVIGAGGLGSPVLSYLAAAGVGTIEVIDFDVVERSNLQRQIVHSEAAIGSPKVESAARRLAAINPEVRVIGHATALDADTVDERVAAVDLVIDGADNFATRYLANDACARAGVPYLWGSILGFAGQVSLAWAGQGACYRCLFPQAPPPGEVPDCATNGVVGALCGVVGGVQASEAIKIITGAGRSLLGRLLVHDALAQTWRELLVRSDPGCAACGDATTLPQARCDEAGAGTADTRADSEEVPEIDVAALAERLLARERGADDFVLVDVREPWEHALGVIDGAVSVPMAQLEAWWAGEGELPAGVDPAHPWVVHCAAGSRSARVVAALRAGGRTGDVSLAGGEAAWRARSGS